MTETAHMVGGPMSLAQRTISAGVKRLSITRIAPEPQKHGSYVRIELTQPAVFLWMGWR